MTFEEEKNDRRGWPESEEPLSKPNSMEQKHTPTTIEGIRRDIQLRGSPELGKYWDALQENERLRDRQKELVEALREVLHLIDDGVLVRDISKDHEPGWAIKQLPLIKTLGKAQSLLSKFEP